MTMTIRPLKLLERVVLEALGQQNCSMAELIGHLQVEKPFVNFFIKNLLQTELVVVEGDKFSINHEKLSSPELHINREEFIKNEIADLILTWIRAHFSKSMKTSLHLQKMWMTDCEELILQSHLKKLEEFIKTVSLEQKKRESKRLPMFKKKLLLWGVGQYGDLIQTSIES